MLDTLQNFLVEFYSLNAYFLFSELVFKCAMLECVILLKLAAKLF